MFTLNTALCLAALVAQCAAWGCFFCARRARRLGSLQLRMVANSLLAAALTVSVCSSLGSLQAGNAMSITISLLSLVVVLPACAAAHVKVNVRPQTERGTDEQYAALCKRFDIEAQITERERYLEGDRIRTEMNARHDQSEKFPWTGMLTDEEWGYFHGLNRQLWEYAQTQADLACGVEWYQKHMNLATEVERAIEEVTTYSQASGNITFDRADNLIRRALYSLSICRNTLAGEGIHTGYGYEFSAVESRLPQALTEARQALTLLKAKVNGEIAYEFSVHGLYRQAEHACNEHRYEDALALLRQARHQAENPDASAETCDLPLALHALAVVCQHQKNHDEAAACYERLVQVSVNRHGPDSFHAADALGYLARHHIWAGDATYGRDVCSRELAILLPLLPGRHTDVRRCLHSQAEAYLKLGQHEQAEAGLRQAVDLSQRHGGGGFGSNLDLEWSRRTLMRYLHSQDRFADALDVLRQLQQQPRHVELRIPSEMREAAKVLRSALRIEEAEKLEQEAAAKEAKYDKHPHHEYGLLEHISTRLAVHGTID